MIDYGYLCQAIVDWRAGRRPSSPPTAAPMMAAAAGGTAPIDLYPSGAPTQAAVEDDIDSDMMEVEEQDDAAANEEVATDVDDLDATADAPPDYDSTRVYGAGGEMPGQSWSPTAADDPETRDS